MDCQISTDPIAGRWVSSFYILQKLIVRVSKNLIKSIGPSQKNLIQFIWKFKFYF